MNFLRTTAANSYKSVPCSFLLKSVCTNKMTTLQLIQRSSGKTKMMILRTMMMTREVSMKQWVALSGEGRKQEVSTNFLCWRQTDMKNTPKTPCKKYRNSFPSKSAKLRAAVERPLLQSVWEMTGVAQLHGFTIAHCTVAKFHRAEQIGHFFSLLSEVNLGSRSKNLFFYRSLHSCSFLPSGLCWQEKRGAF